MSELLIICAILVMIFGAGRLPQLGDALGKGTRNFRKAASGQEEIDISGN
jgi:sec-independent protein translocase protein TatA